MASSNKQIPKDGQVIISIMKEFGITNYEPRVVNMLMEFGIRYVTCILDDARAYANHSSNRKVIDSEDVKLAVMMQLEKIFTTPPPRDLLLEVARTKNSVPLPLVKPHCGIRLPPDRYCFSSCNYKLKTNPKGEKPQQFEKKNKLGPSNTATLSAPGKINKPANSTFNVVKRPANISTVARTQPASNASKPVLKVVEVVRIGTNDFRSYGGDWLVSGQSAAAKAMVKVAGQSQVEVKIEPHDSPMDSSSLKRKLDDQ